MSKFISVLLLVLGFTSTALSQVTLVDFPHMFAEKPLGELTFVDRSSDKQMAKNLDFSVSRADRLKMMKIDLSNRSAYLDVELSKQKGITQAIEVVADDLGTLEMALIKIMKPGTAGSSNLSCGPGSVFTLMDSIQYVRCDLSSENFTRGSLVSLAKPNGKSPVIVGKAINSFSTKWKAGSSDVMVSGVVQSVSKAKNSRGSSSAILSLRSDKMAKKSIKVFAEDSSSLDMLLTAMVSNEERYSFDCKNNPKYSFQKGRNFELVCSTVVIYPYLD